MKFLLDMPVHQRTADWLRERGHDAVHARDIGLSQAGDDRILRKALQEGRIVLTMDLDFPRLLSLESHEGPGVILIRLEKPHPSEIHQRLETLFSLAHAGDLFHAITVIEETRIRIRKLPIF